jgi:saccharopine dehydrogenase (NAD+, L-lysine-forming)
MTNGKPNSIYIYNVSDHQRCFKEVGAQAISYTTGVPAMIGAMLMLTGIWRRAGVVNVEEMDPAPFMAKLMVHGLPWNELESNKLYRDDLPG